MPENQQSGPDRVDRRKGRERRKRDQAAAQQGTLVHLAKLVAVLAGTLVGLLATNIISLYFIGPLRDLTLQAEDIVQQGKDELELVEPEFNRARQEWAPLESLWIELSGSEQDVEESSTASEPTRSSPRTGTEEEPIDGDASASVTEGGPETGAVLAPQPVDEVSRSSHDHTLEELMALRSTYQRLNSKRQRLQDQIDKWQEQIAEYDRSINSVNLLGIVVVIVFAFVGYLFYPLFHRLLVYSTSRWEQLSTELNQRTTQAIVGFMAGVMIALVLLLAAFNTFSMDTGLFALNWFRLLFGAFLVVILGFAGSLTGISYFSPARQAPDPYREFRLPAQPRLLDSSVLIDGRVFDVAAAGFMGGLLIVTNSVLRELQTLADSSDERRRSKGRRGLELVRKMQEDPRIDIRVFDDDQLGFRGFSTDEQLILVANELGAVVATNDYNLNRVAAIRNVRVININELANAVKTNHIPGDFIEIGVVDRGKQAGQGVGYLPDGTMVVVEDGEPYIGQTETIKLTSVTQTVAGRLIFGRVDLAREEQGDGSRV